MKKIILKEKIERNFFNNPLLVSVWMAVVFFSSLITILNGFSLMKQAYLNTLGYKTEQYSKLEKLKTNVNIEYFFDIFGKPTLIKSHNDLNIKTYIFNNTYYYLDATTNSDGTVIVYGITSKREDFKPSFTIPNGSGSKDELITLNKSTFYDISPNAINLNIEDLRMSYEDFCMGYLGVRRFRYFESYYLANQGNYQTFIVGINDGGFMNGSDSFIRELLSNDTNINMACTKMNEKTRKIGVINSFRVTYPLFDSPYFATTAAELFIGIDLDETRVLNNN